MMRRIVIDFFIYGVSVLLLIKAAMYSSVIADDINDPPDTEFFKSDRKILSITVEPLCVLLEDGVIECITSSKVATDRDMQLKPKRLVQYEAYGECALYSDQVICDYRQPPPGYDRFSFFPPLFCGVKPSDQIDCWIDEVDQDPDIHLDRKFGSQVAKIAVWQRYDSDTDLTEALCVFLSDDQDVICYDIRKEDQKEILRVKASAMASYWGQICIIRAKDSKVECWATGMDWSYGTLRDGVTPRDRDMLKLPEFQHISIGNNFGCGIRADSKGINCWGRIPGDLLPGHFEELVCGSDHCCALHSDQVTLTCFGDSISNWRRWLGFP